ncbi:Metallo-dependent phosphatase-like protein [Dichotomocladium elegans]|nr:Metallo-dependent phosphatase-like protein [Dichotomocladium elegans]
MADNDSDRGSSTFKILIATDNHVGYLENDKIRGKDSFKTFEEILILAKQHQVDFVLLGGDLFHDNRPSLYCLNEVITLIREHCYGDKRCEFYIASDQSVNFQSRFPYGANIYDPNLNISIPIFSIHGNHDDPSGMGNLCALDLLQIGGHVNHFGRAYDVKHIKISPVLFKKGSSRLALYGLGNVRDERLHHAWRDGNVVFSRPDPHEEPAWHDDAFNMFVLHQNRVAHGATSYIPETFIPDFMDLVVWGHEHDCRIDPEYCSTADICQPGSSVATSLSEGEAIQKHVGLLEITGRDYTLKKIRLNSVRPFEWTTVQLASVPNLSPEPKQVELYLISVIEDLIDRAKSSWESRSQQQSPIGTRREMPLPLIRVRVDYTGDFEAFNVVVFGKKFLNKVANPKDILKFHRVIARSANTRHQHGVSVSASVPERLDTVQIEDLVSEFLGKSLSVLPENELQDVVRKLIEKDDKNAVSTFVEQSLTRMKRRIMETGERGHFQDLSDESVKRRALALKEERHRLYAREYQAPPPSEPSSSA